MGLHLAVLLTCAIHAQQDGTLHLDKGSVTVDISTTTTLTAIYTKNGKSLDVSNAASWKSSNTDIAAVSGYGKVAAVGTGFVTITTIFGGQEAAAQFTVRPLIRISRNYTNVQRGQSENLKIEAQNKAGIWEDETANAKWTTDDVAIAAASGGIVSGISEGTTICHCSYVGKSIDITVDVSPCMNIRRLEIADGELFSIRYDPANTNIVYAVHNYLSFLNSTACTNTREIAVYKSVDSGFSWTKILVLPEYDVNKVKIEIGLAGCVYVFHRLQIYKSVDSGASFALMPISLLQNTIRTRVNPANGMWFSAGYSSTSTYSQYTVSKSKDEGKTWSPVFDKFAGEILFDPIDENVVYARGVGAGIYKSVDAGDTWTPHLQSVAGANMLAIDPEEPRILYAATNAGVHRSQDGGISWALCSNNIPAISFIYVFASAGKRVYALGSDFNYYRSLDGAQSWEIWRQVHKDFVHTPLSINPAKPNRMIASYPPMISDDGGATWYLVPAGFQSGGNVAYVSKSPPHTIYALSAHASFRSDDGKLWKFLRPSVSIAVSQSDERVIYSINPWNASRTDDGGITWNQIAYQSWSWNPIQVSPNNSLTAYALAGASMVRTDDGGMSWIGISVGAFKPSFTSSFSIDPNNPNIIYAADYLAPTGIFKSENYGSAWAHISPEEYVNDIRTSPHDSAVFVSHRLQPSVTRSLDGGLTWTRIATGMSSAPDQIQIDAVDPSSLYFSSSLETIAGKITYSPNGGANAVPLMKYFGKLYPHPTRKKVLYAGYLEIDLNGADFNSTPTAGSLQTAIGAPLPVFYAKFIDENPGDAATAYRIWLCEGSVLAPAFWDSGMTKTLLSTSDFSRVYDGPSLSWEKRYFWKIKFWDVRGDEGPWSDWAAFETPTPRATLNGPSGSESWQLVGVPTTSSLPVSQIQDNFPNSVIYRWNEPMRKFEMASTLEPGCGYFVKAAATLADISDGTMASADYTIENLPCTSVTNPTGLEEFFNKPANTLRGWNLVCHPFNHPVNWDLVESDGIRPVIYVWNGECFVWFKGSQDGTPPMSGGCGPMIAPFQGFLVRANSPTNHIKFPIAQTEVANFEEQFTDTYWRLQISAENSAAKDIANFVGVHPGAAAGSMNVCDPATIANPYIVAYVETESGPLAQEMRPPASVVTWNVTVQTNFPEQTTLKFPNLKNLPTSWKYYLIDGQTQTELVETHSYNQTELKKTFQIKAARTTSGTDVAISIDGGAIVTNNPEVVLSISGSCNKMRFSNDAQFWTEWEPFAATKQWTLPTAADGARIVYVQTMDVQGNISDGASAAVLLDTVPPGGTLLMPEYMNSATVPLQITATDINPTFGTISMRLSNDGIDWTSWEPSVSSKAWTVPSVQGSRTVFLQLRDAAGNESEVISASTLYDCIEPTVTALINDGATVTSSATFNVTVNAKDDLSGVKKMKINFGQWEDFSESTVVSAPAGLVSIQVMDAAGNVSQVATASIIVDQSAPTGTIAIDGGAAVTNSLQAILAVTASEECDMSLSDNGTIWTVWEKFSPSKNWTLESGTQGTKSVFVRFRDAAGNVSQPAVAHITYDSLPPDLAITLNSGAVWTNSESVTVGIVSQEAVTVRLSNDGSNWSDWMIAGAWVLSNGAGEKTVYAQGKDAAGNVSAVASDTIKFDNEPPVISLCKISSTSGYTNSRSITVAFSAQDTFNGISAMRFTNDGGWTPWGSYQTSLIVQLPAGDGQKSMLVQVVDAAGNVATASDAVYLDQQPPTGAVVINGGAAYTNSPSVTLTISAQDAGIGMDKIRFSDDNVNWAAWEIITTTKSWTLKGGSDGARAVFAQIRDKLGNTLSTSATISYDKTAPALSVLINGGSASVNSANVTIGMSAQDSSPVASMCFSGNAQSWTDWEPFAPTRSFELPVGDGNKSVFAKVRDAAGNESNIAADAIIVDVTSPSLINFTIDNGAAYTLTRAVTLTISASDNMSGLDKIWISENQLASTKVNFSSVLSCNLSAGDGEKTVFVMVQDKAGNLSPAMSKKIILDTEPPTGAVAIVGDYINSLQVNLTYSAVDSGVGVSAARFSNDGLLWSAWEAVTGQKAWTLAPGEDGTRTVYVQFKDVVGRISQPFSGTVMYDTVSPTLAISLAEFSNSTQIIVNASAGDASGIASVRSSEDGMHWSAWQNFQLSFPFQMAAGDGTRKIFAQVKDRAGNISQSASDTIVIDTVAPALTKFTIADDAAYALSSEVALDAEATDELSGIDRVEFSEDPFTWKAGMTFLLSTPDGIKKVYARAIDKAGNISEIKSYTIILDTQPPTGSVSVNAAFTNSLAVVLSVNASDAGVGVFKMRFSNDGTAWSVWESIQTEKQWTLPGGADGTRIVYAQFQDSVGHASQSFSASVQFDTTPPTIAIALNGGAEFANSYQLVCSNDATGAAKIRYSEDGVAWGSWMTFEAAKSIQTSAGEGTRKLLAQARDEAGNVSQAASDSITIDVTPPNISSFKINSGAEISLDLNLMLQSTAGDSLSGVDAIAVLENQQTISTWVPFSPSFSLQIPSGDGQRSFSVLVKDKAGNISSAASDSILVDTKPPSGSISAAAEFTATLPVLVSIFASDEGVGVSHARFSNDGSSWTAWDSYATQKLWNISAGADGVRKIWAQFKDSVGHVSTPVFCTTILDTAAPAAQISINGGAAQTTSVSVVLTISATDAGSGVGKMSFSNEGAAWSEWEGYGTARIWNLVGGGSGARTVYARFKDGVGNISSAVFASIGFVNNVVLQVSPGNLAPPASQQDKSAHSVTAVQFTLHALQDVKLGTIKIAAKGSGDDASSISLVKVCEDVNGDALLDSSDRVIAQGKYSTNDGTVGLGISGEYVLAGQTKTWIVAYDFDGTAASGSTFVARIVEISGTMLAQNLPSATSGLPLDGSEITIAPSGATGQLIVSRGPQYPVDGLVGASNVGVAMMQISMKATSVEPVKVKSLILQASGASKVYILQDVDGNGGYDSGIDVVIASAEYPAGNGEAAFDMQDLLIGCDGVEMLVLCDLPVTGASGETVKAWLDCQKVVVHGFDSGSEVGVIGGIIESATKTIGDPPAHVTILRANVSSEYEVAAGAEFVAALKATFRSDGGKPATVKKIRIRSAGTADDSKVFTKLLVARDDNGDGFYSPETDAVLALKNSAFGSDDGEAVLEFDESIPAGQARTLFIVVSISDGASDGTNFRMSFNDTNVAALDSAGSTVSTSGGTIEGAMIRIKKGAPLTAGSGGGGGGGCFVASGSNSAGWLLLLLVLTVTGLASARYSCLRC